VTSSRNHFFYLNLKLLVFYSSSSTMRSWQCFVAQTMPN